MATKLLIIAGPQSSGKTTAFNYLKSKYPEYHYREEINPYFLAGKNHQGAAFVDHDLEIKLVEADLQMLKSININNHKIVVLETSIFHLVYTEYFSGKNNSFEILAKYQKTIYGLYPLWLKWYDKIPFKKLTIRNSFKTRENFLKKMEERINELYLS